MRFRNDITLGLGFLILLSFVAILQGCSSRQDSNIEITLVRVAMVKNFTDETNITYAGRIKSSADVNLAFRVSGPIKKVAVKEGQFVHKGEVMVQMDSRDYEIQLAATKAEYKQVKAETDRVIELHKRNSVANNDFDKAVAGLHRIEAKLQAHENALKDTRLVAPFSGYIQKKYFEDGEMVKVGLPVIAMVNTSSLEVEAFISAEDYAKRNCFKSFSCNTDIYPEQSFLLNLSGVTPKANLNQLFKMSFTLDKLDRLLLSPGMSVNVNIVCMHNGKSMLIIPVSALFSTGDGSFVWLYDENSETISKKKVNVLKLHHDGLAFVSGDLKSGSSVVSAGVHSLKEGQKVKLLKPVSETNVGGLL